NFYLMATVMKAYTYGLLVDLYDKVPYTDALEGNSNLNPKFDDGYTIYKSVISEIDTALSKDFSARTNTDLTATGEGNIDVVFQGDISKWKQFANTLELKLYLRMVNAKPADAQAGLTALYARNPSFLTDDAGITQGFIDGPGQDNPLYEQNIRQLNTPDNMRASTTLVSFLEANNDPRIVKYFGSTAPKSINQGDFLNNDPNVLTAAVFKQSPTDPVIFISAAESWFLQAEARERYFSGANAMADYNQGVLEAFSAEGLDGSAFVAAGGKYVYPTAGTLDNKIEAIVVQKWASFPYGVHFIEGWFERNRTGYPKSSPVYSSDPSYVPGQFVVSKNSVLNPGQYPKRLVFPDVEGSRNSNTPAIVPATTPVWWGL
ncbi:MAG: SusD/RagB family nutrient-binding outer membrane lipoprotein, partial [Ferruginibacter sp.]